MVTPELIVFIKAQLELGNSPESISATLVAQGWQVQDVQEGFQKAGYSERRAASISVTSGSIPSLNHATLQVLGYKWITLLGLSFITIVIFILATLVPGPLIMYLFTYLVKARPNLSLYLAGGVGYVLFLLITGTLQCWGPLAMIYLILHRNERISIWRTLGRTRRLITRFWSLSLLGSLTALGTLGLSCLPVLFIIINMAKSNHFQPTLAHMTEIPAIIFITSAILGIFTTILISLWLLFSAQSMVDHELKPLDAMVRSKELMAGNMWFVMLRMTIVIVMSVTISGLLAVITPNLKHTPYAGSIIQIIGTSMIMMLGLIYGTLLYEHVRDHRAHAVRHIVRDKATFIILTLLGFVLPITIVAIVIMSLGPFFSGFLQNFMTKELQKNAKELPSPLPSYLQNNMNISPQSSESGSITPQ